MYRKNANGLFERFDINICAELTDDLTSRDVSRAFSRCLQPIQTKISVLRSEPIRLQNNINRTSIVCIRPQRTRLRRRKTWYVFCFFLFCFFDCNSFRFCKLLFLAADFKFGVASIVDKLQRLGATVVVTSEAYTVRIAVCMRIFSVN